MTTQRYGLKRWLIQILEVAPTISQLDQRFTDNDQTLEMALLNLKRKGRIEALKVLFRALEANPSSAVLWVVYLHIYYSNEKSIGKDDLFCFGVELNKGSYELWLMYINSRIQLDQRFTDNDQTLEMALLNLKRKGRIEALKVLFRALEANPSSAVLWVVYLHIYYSNEKSIGKDDLFCFGVELNKGSYELWLIDAVHASACILDLFLQLVNCLCISGNVGKAMEKIYGIFPSTKDSDEPHSQLLSDILPCLTLYDKCIFWLYCVYYIVYKKLPDAILQYIKKPIVQQAVSNIWSLVSSDFSLVNLVLEVWHGPSLLSQTFSKLNNLVDLVEAVIGIIPLNYQLAMYIYKLLSKRSDLVDVTYFWFTNSVPLVRKRHGRAFDSGHNRLPPSSSDIATHLAIVFSHCNSILSFEAALVRNQS
ncbi:hypothetical protein TEA_014314 [Camellia sinensis var. sinensis]|uniref:Uncharacterized protein n=1 Tax=Camellia sinensis var. sinensis TaxID=542762 RepID=A0A4S4EDL8_CAMSN|nr:hypothetical protein TEA_014314 [Camellia sinensis var. sinensis]